MAIPGVDAFGVPGVASSSVNQEVGTKNFVRKCCEHECPYNSDVHLLTFVM